MFRLQSVGVISVGRTMAVMQGAIALLFVPIFGLAAIVGAFAAPGEQKLSALLFIGMAVALPFFYAAIGFVMGVLMAAAYNLVAAKFGGIEMQFAPTSLVPGTGLPNT